MISCRQTAKYVLLILGALLFVSPAFAEKIKEWQMLQKEKSMGTHTFFFCPNAIKIIDKGRGFTIVSKAPDWSIDAFRDDDKTICHLTRRQFYNKYAFKIKHGHTKTAVLKIYKFGPYAAPMYYGQYHNDVIKRFDGVPIEVEDLISSFYKSSCVDGIVLRSVSNSIPRTKTDPSAFMAIDMNPTGVIRETLKLAEVPYTDSYFKIPANYRKVSDIGQIMTGKTQRKEAESIFLDMGIGDELGKPKAK